MAARQALAEAVVGVADERHRDAARQEGAEALAGRAVEGDADGVVGQPFPAVPLGHLVAQHRAARAVGVADLRREADRRARLERRRAAGDQLVVERVLQPVILLDHLAPGHRRRQVGQVQHGRQVEALRLPVIDGRLHVQAVGAADHVVDLPEAELGHQLAHFLGDEPEEVLDELGLAGELRAQLGILRGDPHRARVQVADAHHDAAHHDERRRGEAELLGAEQRADDDVAPGLHLPVHLHGDAVAQLVQHQHLLGFRQAQFPGQPGVLQAGQRRRTGAAVVTRDQHDVRVRLGHAGRHRADAALGHELHGDRGRRGSSSSGRRSAAPGPRSSRCRGAAAAR